MIRNVTILTKFYVILVILRNHDFCKVQKEIIF